MSEQTTTSAATTMLGKWTVRIQAPSSYPAWLLFRIALLRWEGGSDE